MGEYKRRLKKWKTRLALIDAQRDQLKKHINESNKRLNHQIRKKFGAAFSEAAFALYKSIKWSPETAAWKHTMIKAMRGLNNYLRTGDMEYANTFSVFGSLTVDVTKEATRLYEKQVGRTLQEEATERSSLAHAIHRDERRLAAMIIAKDWANDGGLAETIKDAGDFFGLCDSPVIDWDMWDDESDSFKRIVASREFTPKLVKAANIAVAAVTVARVAAAGANAIVSFGSASYGAAGTGFRFGASSPGAIRMRELDVLRRSYAAVHAKAWTMSPTARGNFIEAFLDKTQYRDWWNCGAIHGGSFPLVDFQRGRIVVSLKTVDTSGTSWMGRMRSHIRDLGTRGITCDGRAARTVLDLRVQRGGAGSASGLIDYGRKFGVDVIIREF